jgi:hypothetical protein
MVGSGAVRRLYERRCFGPAFSFSWRVFSFTLGTVVCSLGRNNAVVLLALSQGSGGGCIPLYQNRPNKYAATDICLHVAGIVG